MRYVFILYFNCTDTIICHRKAYHLPTRCTTSLASHLTYSMHKNCLIQKLSFTYNCNNNFKIELDRVFCMHLVYFDFVYDIGFLNFHLFNGKLSNSS